MSLGQRLLHRPQSLRLRGWLFQVHLWAGLIVGLYAVVIGLSGSIIVFRESVFERRLHPFRHVTPQAQRRPVEEWVATARQATGHQGPFNLELPTAPDEAAQALVYTRGAAHFLLIDPYTAGLLLDFTPKGTAVQWIDQMHSNFFLGRTGRVINGVGALVLLLLALTGALIWWPGRGLFLRRTRVDFGASWRRINFDLHHVLSFWTFAGFVLLSVTGAFFTWPQFYRATVARFFVVDPPQPLRVAPPEGSAALPLAELIAAAERAAPGRPTRSLQLPGSPGQPLQVIQRGDGDPEHRTNITIHVNPYTAEVLRIDRYESQPAGNRILAWIGPLHGGSFGGWPVRLLYALLGLVFPALFLTGFLMWWQRVVRRRLIDAD